MIMIMTGGGNPPSQRRDLGLHIEGLTVIQHAAYQYILMFKQVLSLESEECVSRI